MLGVTGGSHDHFWICSRRDNLFSSNRLTDKLFFILNNFLENSLVPERKEEMKMLVKDHLAAKFIEEQWTNSL